MRDQIKLPSHLLASGHDVADPLRKRGAAAETARALREWSAKHPNPFTPRSRKARQNFANQTAK